MKEKILPPLVLTIICALVCGLLVFAYNLTYVDTTGMITDKMKDALTEIYGTSDGYEMQKNDDGTVTAFDGVDSVIKGSDGTVAFEITSDGYSKGGLYMLVGMDTDGSIKGISIMTIGETPGLGTKVQDKSFLDSFAGLSAESDVDAVTNVTGATRSSNGMKRAAETAIRTYSEQKEVIFGE